MDPAQALIRSVGVAKLDIPTIEAVEADTSLTQEAGAVVVVTSIIGSIGMLFSSGLWAFLIMIAATLVGWFVWAWISAFIAEKLFGSTTTDTGEMLRTMGYASGPRVLGIIPFIGGLVGAIWHLVAVVVAVRQAGEISTMQAAIAAAIGWLPQIIVAGIVFNTFT